MTTDSYLLLREALAGFIPPARLITDPLRLLTWGTDASFYRLVPQIAVVVESEDEVVRLLARMRAAQGARSPSARPAPASPDRRSPIPC